MYKAVVLDTKDGFAAILRDDGTFAKIKRDALVGEVLYLSDEKKVVPFSRMSRVVAAAAAVSVCLFGGFYYTVPACSYVSLDVNPSIEFAMNRIDRVVGVTPLNEDAEAVTEQLYGSGIRYDTLSDALSKTEQVLSEQGYISDEENYYLINISSDSERRRGQLEREVGAAFGDRDEERFHMVLGSSDRAARDEAAKLGISTGRYEEIRRIERDGSGAMPDKVNEDAVRDYAAKPVYDLFVESGEIEPPTGQAEQKAQDNKKEPASDTSTEGKQDNGAGDDKSADGKQDNGVGYDKNADGKQDNGAGYDKNAGGKQSPGSEPSDVKTAPQKGGDTAGQGSGQSQAPDGAGQNPRTEQAQPQPENGQMQPGQLQPEQTQPRQSQPEQTQQFQPQPGSEQTQSGPEQPQSGGAPDASQYEQVQPEEVPDTAQPEQIQPEQAPDGAQPAQGQQPGQEPSRHEPDEKPSGSSQPRNEDGHGMVPEREGRDRP